MSTLAAGTASSFTVRLSDDSEYIVGHLPDVGGAPATASVGFRGSLRTYFEDLSHSRTNTPRPSLMLYTQHWALAEYAVMGNTADDNTIAVPLDYADQRTFSETHNLNLKGANYAALLMEFGNPASQPLLTDLLTATMDSAPSASVTSNALEGVLLRLMDDREVSRADARLLMQDPALVQHERIQQHVELYMQIWEFTQVLEIDRAARFSVAQRERMARYEADASDATTDLVANWFEQIRVCRNREEVENYAESVLQGVGSKSVIYFYHFARLADAYQTITESWESGFNEIGFTAMLCTFNGLVESVGVSGLLRVIDTTQNLDELSPEILELRQVLTMAGLAASDVVDTIHTDPGRLTPMRVLKIAGGAENTVHSIMSPDYTADDTVDMLCHMLRYEMDIHRRALIMYAQGRAAEPRRVYLSTSEMYYALATRESLYGHPAILAANPLTVAVNNLAAAISNAGDGSINVREFATGLVQAVFATMPETQADLMTSIGIVFEGSSDNQAWGPNVTIDPQAGTANSIPGDEPARRPVFRTTNTGNHLNTGRERFETCVANNYRGVGDVTTGYFAYYEPVSFYDPDVHHALNSTQPSSVVSDADLEALTRLCSVVNNIYNDATVSPFFLFAASLRSSFLGAGWATNWNTLSPRFRELYNDLEMQGVVGLVASFSNAMPITNGVPFPLDATQPIHVDTTWQNKVITWITNNNPRWLVIIKQINDMLITDHNTYLGYVARWAAVPDGPDASPSGA